MLVSESKRGHELERFSIDEDGDVQVYFRVVVLVFQNPYISVLDLVGDQQVGVRFKKDLLRKTKK